jgi:hypothetical protein
MQAKDPDQTEGRPLSWFNADIERCLHGYRFGGTSQGRKAFFKRLLQIEAERERRYAVEAPVRRYNSK